MQDITNLLSKVDTNGLVGKLLGGMATKNFAAGLLTGGVASSLLGGKVGDTVEGAAKLGGLALLGTLAYKAYGNYQQTKQAGGTANVADSVKQSAQDMFSQAKALASGAMASMAAAQQAPASVAANSELPLAVMRSMIAAAKADGVMDANETQKIMQNLETAGLSLDEKVLVMQELANSPSVESIASAAKSPEDAAQIYLAALLVCDSQCAREQAFLSTLANAMKLDANFTASLQQQLLSLPTAQAA